MRDFISYSQAGQDVFVYEKLVKPTNNLSGTFLDIGCSHPFAANNTVALEKLGWRGLLIDKNPEMVELCRENRTSPVFEGDATKIDWLALCGKYELGRGIDYLSLDIDDQLGEESKTLLVLENLVSAGFQFCVITCEHNFYLLGDGVRTAIREFLQKNFYDLSVADVSDDNLVFEDWWTHQ